MPEHLADVGRSDLELRGLNDYAFTGSGPTRQSDTRDSEPLLVSVAGARAGSLLFDTSSFFLCDADLSEASRQNIQTTSAFFLVTILPKKDVTGLNLVIKETSSCRA